MTILKNASMPAVSKRKIFAVLLLALTLTNSPVSVAKAAEPEIQSSWTAPDQNVPALLTNPAVQPTVQDVLLDVCKSNGYGQDCAKTLLGMLWNESSNSSTAIGDHGAARGYFQIHYKLHNVSIACAEDLVCSANWTLTYMEAHSYPKYVNYAIQCHNSCNVNNGYAAKAVRNGKLYWSQPLAITQAAPITIGQSEAIQLAAK